MREKLIELIQSAVNGCATYWAGLIADHLIANGVTFQDRDIHWATEQAYKNGYEDGYEDGKPKWIPVTERLPEKITNKVIVLCKNGYRGFGHYENYKGKQTWYNLESDKPFTDWDLEDCESYEVTHWMPLPEQPKGE